MVFTAWGWGQAWIDVSLGAFLLMSVLAPAINSPRFKAIRQAIASEPDRLLTDEISQLTHDPVLRASTFTMGFMTSGIVCLMTTKPGWIGAAAIMAVAFVASLIAARLPLGVARSVQPVAQPSPMEVAPEEELIHS
jgi:hypothetical protein